MKKLILISTLLSLISSQSAFSHPGRVAKDGCHTNKKTAKHHCHKKSDKTKKLKKSKKAKK